MNPRSFPGTSLLKTTLFKTGGPERTRNQLPDERRPYIMALQCSAVTCFDGETVQKCTEYVMEITSSLIIEGRSFPVYESVSELFE